MQVIYLAPFVLLSLVLFVVFLSVPRLRRHAVSAAVAPVGFAISSIVGVFATVMIAEHFGLGRTFDAEGPGRIVAFFAVYALIGTVGAIVAVSVVNRLLRWVLQDWQPWSD